MFPKLNLTARFDDYCFVSEVHVLSFSSCREIYKPDNTYALFQQSVESGKDVAKFSLA